MKKLFFILSLLFIPIPAFAVDVTVTHTMVNVTATSAAVTSRESRRLLILENISDATISCKFNVTAVVGEVIVLNPQPASGQSGGGLFLDAAIPMGPLFCVHDG